jgi:flagellar biosynthesis protein FlhF
MIMKRFIAAEMRQVMQQVTDELGEDALILSNRKVEDGIEVIAAVDYEDELASSLAAPAQAAPVASAPDAAPAPAAPVHAAAARPAAGGESAVQEVRQELRALRSMLEMPLTRLAWQSHQQRDPVRAGIMERLDAVQLHPVIANHVADRACGSTDLESGWQGAQQALASLLPVADDELLEHGGVVALIGPTGVGKTTTIAKLAARFALRHGRRHVALVTMDHYRIGAHDQLRTYGKLLGVPVFIAGDEQELSVILSQMNDRRLILIDTAGTSQRDRALQERFAALEQGGLNIQRYLVLSANAQLDVCDDVVQAFGLLQPGKCILTKLDEATSLGGVLSVLVRHRLPLAFVSDGQQVPDDLHTAAAQGLVARALELAAAVPEASSEAAWLHALDTTEAAAHALAIH